MVSVIIPAYNVERFIAETIDSVLVQSYSNWELIIIDDGSNDNTATIIQKYCETDSRINYFYQPNSGVSIARNNGLSKAKGKYIALLDADDVWEKDNLTLKIAFLEENPDTKWVYSDMYDADENMNIIKTGATGTDNNILESILLWKREVVPGPCSNVVFSKICYDQGVLFDKNLSTAADQDFTLQLASKYKGHHIKNPLWKYRILNNSMSRNIKTMEKDHINVFTKASQNGLFKSFWFKQKCFSNLYWILAGSWWKNGNNPTRGFYFIVKALLANPFSIFRLFNALGK